jgi:Asp-tRNA(Asn)/Glu-tRNA(Gln) amidotransferase A subunit family amidase
MTAAEAAGGFKAGSFTATEMVEASLARIAAHDPALGAFTCVTAARARAQAAVLDARHARGEDCGPLAGALFAVKNLYDIAGEVTLAGSRINRDHAPAKADATLVALAFQAVGQRQSETWLASFDAHAKPRSLLTADAAAAAAAAATATDERSAAMLNLVYLDGWFFAMLAGYFTATVRRGLTPALAEKSAVVFSRIERATDVRAVAAAVAPVSICDDTAARAQTSVAAHLRLDDCCALNT